MTCALEIRPEAVQDIDEAASRYENQRPGLGNAFLSELDDLFELITTYPLQFPEIEPTIRKAPLGRFPYGVYYTVESDPIVVLAVIHFRRHPSTWKHRLRMG